MPPTRAIPPSTIRRIDAIWRIAGLIPRDPHGSSRRAGGSSSGSPSSSIIADGPRPVGAALRRRAQEARAVDPAAGVEERRAVRRSPRHLPLASGPRRCVWPKRTHFASMRRRSTTSLIASTPARVIALGERSARTGPSPRRFATPDRAGQRDRAEEPAAQLGRAAPASGRASPRSASSGCRPDGSCLRPAWASA